MPNWTANTITVRGAKAKLAIFKDKVQGENGAFDFNRIEPMPESLTIESGTRTDIGLGCFYDDKFKYWQSMPWFSEQYPDVQTREQFAEYIKEHEPEAYKLGEIARDNIEKYGVPTWYDWAYEHWGTKWNACEVELVEGDGALTYSFDTAWDAPRPLVDPIVEMAGELGLSIVWTADHEDSGYEPIVDTSSSQAA